MDANVIVHGDDALTRRIVEELSSAGSATTMIAAAADLAAVDVQAATAVVCAGSDDAVNLEIALLARQLNPQVRVVTHLSNRVLREAVAHGNGPGAVLDVAELAAPSVLEAALARTTHSITVAGTEFVVSGSGAPRTGTLRELYGDLAPVAVIRGEFAASPGAVVACPGRDLMVAEGDWVAMIDTAEELAGQSISTEHPLRAAHHRPRGPMRVAQAVRDFRDDVNPNLFRALGVSFTLLIGATLLLRYTYDKPGMSFVDALYFSTETIATVGYGDFSFVDQPTWLRLFSIVLMFAGVGTTAILMAFVADLLLSRRLGQSAGRRRARQFTGHVIVVGLGSFGIRVAADLRQLGYDVAVVERDQSNRYLSTAADLGVPVIFGDATVRQTLDDARISSASAVVVLTQDDMVNVETGIAAREALGVRWSGSADAPGVPVVLRVFDHALGDAVARRFGFAHVRSTVELAAPWFIGAALGLDVSGTFSVGQRSFMVGGVSVRAGSALDGASMSDLPTQTRVIAIESANGEVVEHPRRDDRLAAGDTAYLVGPYHELLATLQRGTRSADAHGV